MDIHHNQYRTNDNALNATAKDRVCKNWQGLVYNHVCQDEGDQEQVAVFAEGHNLLGIFLLFSTKLEFKLEVVKTIEESKKTKKTKRRSTYGVPLWLSTCSCVSSRLM